MVHMVNGTPTDSIIYRPRQFRSGVNMKTGNYGCCCNDSLFSRRNVVYVQEQPKIPTAVKVGLWAQAIGSISKALGSVVSFFTGLFGKKKVAATPTQTPTATQSSQVKPESQGVTTPATTTTATVKPAEAEEPDEKAEPKKKDNAKKAPTSVDMKNFSGNIIVHDDELFAQLGEKADIVGKTTVSEEKGQDGYPKSMQVGNYNYSLAKVDSDGTVWYKSQNGSGQLYRLEKNADGTFGLNQHAGDEGVGEADVSKFKKASTSTSKKATTSTESSKAKSASSANKPEKSPTDSDSSAILSRPDKEIKEHMTVKQSSIKFADSKIVNGKQYFPQTVTCVIPPIKSKEVSVRAEKVAEFNGDEAKIKDWALAQMRAEDKKSE